MGLASVGILSLTIAAGLVAGWMAPLAGTRNHTLLITPWPTPIRHVIVVFFENQEVGTVLANGSYERSLATTYADAGQFYSVMHYSLPNYEAATSGISSNLLSVSSTRNVADLARDAGRSWGGFFEGMPSPCATASNGSYDIYHNPFLAYRDVVGNPSRCAGHVVNLDVFTQDLESGHIPAYSFIAPNTTDDGHSSGVAFADAWLQGWLPTILGSPLFASTAVLLTYDEGNTSLGINNSTGGGHVYTVVVSPYARLGYTSTVQYNTYSLLTTTEWLLGMGRTGHNDNWSVSPPMTDLFDFSPHYSVGGHALSANGTAVPGALISGNGTVGTPLNPLTGHFTLWLPNGTYDLSVTAPGFAPYSFQVTVAGSPVRSLAPAL